VITQAKRTRERAWLAEVASVALVQACQDARRAYRNWFDSRSGRRKGRRVGRPRFRTKHGRQSIRLTRNGFALHGARLYVAKVGEVRMRWSRALPSVPSSVTVIGEPDGRFYASLVVERDPTPLPPVARTAGIDLGLASLAVVAGSDGTVEAVANPRYLRTAQRRLARAQRSLSRKQKGSANHVKARMRVATVHRKVRDRRAGHHHKLALRLLREHQVVAVEDLCVAGLGRTRLAKSVHDAGWATLVRLLEDKAAQHRRRVVKIGRWEPTSQTCSACGYRRGPQPLGVRAWACQACGVAHDRDVNAAVIFWSPPGWRRPKTPVEAVSAQGHSWQLPVKQEPAEAPHERRGRNPRRSPRGGGQRSSGGLPHDGGGWRSPHAPVRRVWSGSEVRSEDTPARAQVGE
jgi:putative transposase